MNRDNNHLKKRIPVRIGASSFATPDLLATPASRSALSVDQLPAVARRAPATSIVVSVRSGPSTCFEFATCFSESTLGPLCRYQYVRLSCSSCRRGLRLQSSLPAAAADPSGEVRFLRPWSQSSSPDMRLVSMPCLIDGHLAGDPVSDSHSPRAGENLVPPNNPRRPPS